MNDDELLLALERIDPLRAPGDAPPARGSTRYDSILERAMRTTDLDSGSAVTPTGTGGSHLRRDRPGRPARTARRTRRRPAPARRPAVLALAAAAAVILAAAVVLLRPDGATRPAEALSRAAATTAEVGSLRGSLTRVGPFGEHTSTIEVDGTDLRVESQGTYRDGHVEGSTTVVIDRQITQVAADGTVERSTIDADDEQLRPFAASSAAVVTTALTGSHVAEIGTDRVRDVEATHYRIEPDDATRQALAALAPGELAWFELEYPDRVTSIDIWVADDLVRRIEVVADVGDDPAEQQVETTTIDYFDFNADITITPPTDTPPAPSTSSP